MQKYTSYKERGNVLNIREERHQNETIMTFASQYTYLAIHVCSKTSYAFQRTFLLRLTKKCNTRYAEFTISKQNQ